MTLYTIGIDPGATGAIAIIRDGVLATALDMPYVDGHVLAPSHIRMSDAARRKQINA